MTRIKVGEKRTYTDPLRREWLKVPRWRRSKRAVDALHSYVEKHTKVDNVKISNWLNQSIWKNGGKNPPAKIDIEVTIENRKVQDKKTKKDVDIPFAVAELATLSKRETRLDEKRAKKVEKFVKTAKPESAAKVEGKDAKELAKSLTEKLKEKTQKKKAEPKEHKKSAKEISAELHETEDVQKKESKKQAKVTKAQEMSMRK